MSGRRLRGAGHVAERLIGDEREPSVAETRHLETCPTCFAAVRRGRSFDRQLAGAIATLSESDIPREVLTMSTPPIRRPSAPSLASMGVVGALIVAAGLVAWTVLPRDLGASAGASGSPSATVAPDPHLVVTDDATWRIGLAGSAIEVRRTSRGASREDLLLRWDLGEGIGGGSVSALRCPVAGGGDQWVVIGRQAPHQNFGIEDPSHPPVWAVASGPLFAYEGPPAAGQAAPDGLFIYVIDPRTFDPTTPIRIKAPGYTQGSGFGGLQPYPTDVREPSGCFFTG